jgi:hypothetical protein
VTIGQFSLETIEHVRSLSPIEQVIGEHVRLHRSGPGLIGLCPFHQEGTPSFRVNAGKFHCFGCGLGGDVFDFIQRLHDLSFPQAVRHLAQRAGFKLDGFEPSSELSAKVHAMKAERERERDFEHFYNLRVDAIGRQYRELGRRATLAETLLRQGSVLLDSEMLAWDALENFTLFQLKVEREGLCDPVVIRDEWEKLNHGKDGNDTASDQLEESSRSVRQSSAG